MMETVQLLHHLALFPGGQIQSQNFSPGAGNTSGCLTITFTSDASGVGNFAAAITCGVPCEPPFAIVNTGQNEEPLLLCVDELATFNGSNSTTSNGFSIASYEWHMGDGTILTGGPTVEHSYSEPGGYRVQLFITDSNDCNNTNLTDFLVFVSTAPTFANTTPNQLACVDQDVSLHGEVLGTTWNELPNANFGGALFIPDDQSQCFSNAVTFTNFAPGQVVTQTSDIENFFINFEHSFMGDLTISFICPNGQTMMVHQQGGGGTFLGIPVDNDGLPNDEGVGFDYYWSPTATNGTWAENAGGTLPSGTYESVQPFTNFIGCPLNGSWTIQVCDLWGSDNGFIFDWAVNFNPDLFPDLMEFTPTFDPGPTSTFWTGPGIISTSADGNDIVVNHDTPGTYVYTFHAIDNFGCEYSHDVNVQIEPRPIVVASTVGSPCGENPTLLGTISNPNPVLGTYTYSWTPSNLVNNPGSAQTTTQTLTTNTVFVITVHPTNIPGCTSEDIIQIFVEDVEPLAVLSPNQSTPCPETPVQLTATPSGGYPDYTYLWSNGETTQTITVSPAVTTTYTVVVSDQCDDLESPVTVTVTIPGTEITAIDVEGCANFPLFIGDIEGGTGNYTLDLPDGISFNPNLFTVISNAPGVYTFDITDDCIGSGQVNVTFIECDVILPNIITPNGDDLNDILVFEGLEYLPKSKLRVWNRWGQLVFESDDYKNNWKGDDLSEGVYFYALTLPLGEEYTSTLQLVRK